MNFDNYQKTAQKGLFFCLVAATVLLCHGVITGENGSLKLSLVAVSGAWVILIFHFSVRAIVKGETAMALSEERRVARVFMLRHAAAWLLDQESTELTEGADGHPDQVKLKEALAVAKRLEAMADRLEAKR